MTAVAKSDLGIIEGMPDMKAQEGMWNFDEDDWLLLAMCADPIFCAELLFEEPLNYEHAGCYTVMDYQYPLFRPRSCYAGFPCARSVGKTESIKARACSHAFKRQREDLLLTAPQMIHLEPLTEAIEARITAVRLLREFLKKENQKTGFTHKPFQCDFADGTKIIGRIPQDTGKGVKGMHEPDLMVDEGQDYPEKGWTEVHETVMKDHVNSTGEFDFTYHFYGVHAGMGGGKFHELATGGSFKITCITAPMKPGWNKREKEAAAAMYGGTSSPDYRRNLLGEPGTGSSQFFVTARLMACVDQDKESKYNSLEYKAQDLHSEELENMLPAGGDVGTLLDLPDVDTQEVYCGMDIGLVTDPTVIMIFVIVTDKTKKRRLKLIRMIHLWRFRERQIRQCTYRIAMHYGKRLRMFGQDITGIGLPLLQTMEDDEVAPDHLKEVTRGYVFNAKMVISVDPNFVSKRGSEMMDQYGNLVEERRNIATGNIEMLTKMSMIEASTRYLRQFIDSGFLWLPWAPLLVRDMQGETEQRVKAMAGMKKKPNAFHMLDAMRVMAMAYKSAELEEMVYQQPQRPVIVRTVGAGTAGGGNGGAVLLGS